MEKYLCRILDKTGKIVAKDIIEAKSRKEADKKVGKDAEWLGCNKWELQKLP